MKFASFGRERDLSIIQQNVTEPELKARYLLQATAAHDLNDGIGSVDAFIEASREAIFQSTERSRGAPLSLLQRVAKYYPECLVIWFELSESSEWRNRFTVACRLYWYVPDAESDQLFNTLRNDRSMKVREFAIDRYENRPNPKYVEKIFDASQFDERVRRGEIRV